MNYMVVIIMSVMVGSTSILHSMDLVAFKSNLLSANTPQALAQLLGYDAQQVTLQLDQSFIEGFYLYTQAGVRIPATPSLALLNKIWADELHPFVFGAKSYKDASSVVSPYPISSDNRYAVIHALHCIQKPNFIKDGHAHDERAAVARKAACLRNFVAQQTGENNLLTGKNHGIDRCRAYPVIMMGIGMASICGLLAVLFGAYRPADVDQEQSTQAESPVDHAN